MYQKRFSYLFAFISERGFALIIWNKNRIILNMSSLLRCEEKTSKRREKTHGKSKFRSIFNGSSIIISFIADLKTWTLVISTRVQRSKKTFRIKTRKSRFSLCFCFTFSHISMVFDEFHHADFGQNLSNDLDWTYLENVNSNLRIFSISLKSND